MISTKKSDKMAQNRPDHSFKPTQYGDYECEFCGIDAYHNLDSISKKYPPCNYKRLTTIPKVVKRKKSVFNIKGFFNGTK